MSRNIELLLVCSAREVDLTYSLTLCINILAFSVAMSVWMAWMTLSLMAVDSS